MRIEKTIDRDSKQKLYVQIYSIIKDKIETGEWPADTQIPTEDDLCKMYDVSKVTVREAIQELVREGSLKRQQGKGTFVTYSVPHPGLGMRTRLSEDIFGEGVTVNKEILAKGIHEPSEDIRRVMMTEDDLYYILCRKVVDGKIYAEELFIPLFIFPDTDIDREDVANRSLYEIIEEKSVKKIFRVVQTCEITEIKENMTSLMHMKEGAPALLMTRTLISSDGTTIGYSRLIGSGSRSMIQIEFERIR
jgi:DNA-binding GntR family transcriptional regulator